MSPPRLQVCRNKRSHPIPIINLFLAGLIDFEIVCNGRQKILDIYSKKHSICIERGIKQFFKISCVTRRKQIP